MEDTHQSAYYIYTYWLLFYYERIFFPSVPKWNGMYDSYRNDIEANLFTA